MIAFKFFKPKPVIEEPEEEQSGELKIEYIPVNEIKPNPNQPRKFFDATALRELSESIIQYGVIQPITVRKVRCGYEIVTGERRLRASQLAGLETIPAIVINADNDKSAILALLENLQREDLSFFEIAEGYHIFTFDSTFFLD